MPNNRLIAAPAANIPEWKCPSASHPCLAALPASISPVNPMDGYLPARAFSSHGTFNQKSDLAIVRSDGSLIESLDAVMKPYCSTVIKK